MPPPTHRALVPREPCDLRFAQSAEGSPVAAEGGNKRIGGKFRHASGSASRVSHPFLMQVLAMPFFEGNEGPEVKRIVAVAGEVIVDHLLHRFRPKIAPLAQLLW